MKYIDADRLKAEIERRKALWQPEINIAGSNADSLLARISELEYLISFIDSLQQEQPKEINDDEKIMNFFDALGDCGFSQHDILLLKNIWKEAGCPLPKSQVADASKMAQEVDLEREAVMFCFDNGINITPRKAKEIARHFAEWGAIHLNARKEE